MAGQENSAPAGFALAGRGSRGGSRRSRGFSGRSHGRSRSVSRSHFGRSGFRSSGLFGSGGLVAGGDRQSSNRNGGNQGRTNDFGGHWIQILVSQVRGQGAVKPWPTTRLIPVSGESRKGIFHKTVIACALHTDFFHQKWGIKGRQGRGMPPHPRKPSSAARFACPAAAIHNTVRAKTVAENNPGLKRLPEYCSGPLPSAGSWAAIRTGCCRGRFRPKSGRRCRAGAPPGPPG